MASCPPVPTGRMLPRRPKLPVSPNGPACSAPASVRPRVFGSPPRRPGWMPYPRSGPAATPRRQRRSSSPSPEALTRAPGPARPGTPAGRCRRGRPGRTTASACGRGARAGRRAGSAPASDILNRREAELAEAHAKAAAAQVGAANAVLRAELAERDLQRGKAGELAIAGARPAGPRSSTGTEAAGLNEGVGLSAPARGCPCRGSRSFPRVPLAGDSASHSANSPRILAVMRRALPGARPRS